MKHTFTAIERTLTYFTGMLACMALTIAVCLAIFQVFTRFILEEPAEWTEPIIRYSLIWMVTLGLPTAFRLGAMVSVDVLRQVGPPWVVGVLRWGTAIVTLFLLSILIWYGWDYSLRGRFQTMSGIESISMLWAYISIPVGAACATLGVIGNLLDPVNNELETAQ